MNKKSIVIHIIGVAMVICGIAETIYQMYRTMQTKNNNVNSLEWALWVFGTILMIAVVAFLIAGMFGKRNIYALHCFIGRYAIGFAMYLIAFSYGNRYHAKNFYSATLISILCSLVTIISLLLYLNKRIKAMLTMIAIASCMLVCEVLNYLDFCLSVFKYGGTGIAVYLIIGAKYLLPCLLSLITIGIIVWCVENDRKAEDIVEKNCSEQ